MKRPVLALAVVAIALLGCSGGNDPSPSSNSTGTTTTVLAQSGLSVANIVGVYAFTEAGLSSGFNVAGTGIAVADGKGVITSGDETVSLNGAICHYTFTGSYSVSSNGTGNATFSLTPDSASLAKGCSGGSEQLKLAIANAGNTVFLTSLQSTETLLVSAIKQ